jgi:hypothetical protein
MMHPICFCFCFVLLLLWLLLMVLLWVAPQVVMLGVTICRLHCSKTNVLHGRLTESAPEMKQCCCVVQLLLLEYPLYRESCGRTRCTESHVAEAYELPDQRPSVSAHTV